jgi:hypothetical protein
VAPPISEDRRPAPAVPADAESRRRPPSAVMDPTVATAVASEFKSNPPSNEGCHSRT